VLICQLKKIKMKNYKFTINGHQYSVDIIDIQDRTTNVEVNGTPYQVVLETEVSKPAPPPKPVVAVATPVEKPMAAPLTTPVTAAPKASVPAGGRVIKSPLPGAVLDIFVKVGDVVKQGQQVIKLEAMKMENNIDSDYEGVVKEIRVHKNDSVMEGDVLIVFE